MNKGVKNEEELKDTIESILRSINETENPVELSAYKKFFQRHVPLTRRSYVAAFLLKNGGGISKNTRTKTRPSNVASPDKKRARTKNELSKDEKRIFLNIGRQQGVNPGDIRAFFESVADVEKTDIGYISIHYNFSFVSVQNKKIDQVISSLDGKELKGKNVAVCIAKKQK